MQRLKILTWHVHGSYLNTLARIEHDWYLPVKPGRPEGYGGRGMTFDLPASVREIPAQEVRDLDLDLVLYQSQRNYMVDRCEILSPEQQCLPAIYLEHNTPRPHACDTQHPLNDPDLLLVHVTQYNRLMWDCRETPTTVIEHSVAIDPSVRYHGTLQCGLTVVNAIQKRPRIAGLDLYQQAQEHIALNIAGMQTEEIGGLGDIPYTELHRRMASYRFLFSPIRYTSLPLAVIEAMTIGMPVIALATTELPSVIENGKNGYISNDPAELFAHMRRLVDQPEEARMLGQGAYETARRRFSLARFIRDWDAAFAAAITRPQRQS
jgi:glycosyltransferase involved in cell wall biosynthesis